MSASPLLRKRNPKGGKAACSGSRVKRTPSPPRGIQKKPFSNRLMKIHAKISPGTMPAWRQEHVAQPSETRTPIAIVQVKYACVIYMFGSYIDQFCSQTSPPTPAEKQKMLADDSIIPFLGHYFRNGPRKCFKNWRVIHRNQYDCFCFVRGLPVADFRLFNAVRGKFRERYRRAERSKQKYVNIPANIPRTPSVVNPEEANSAPPIGSDPAGALGQSAPPFARLSTPNNFQQLIYGSPYQDHPEHFYGAGNCIIFILFIKLILLMFCSKVRTLMHRLFIRRTVLEVT